MFIDSSVLLEEGFRDFCPLRYPFFLVSFKDVHEVSLRCKAVTGRSHTLIPEYVLEDHLVDEVLGVGTALLMIAKIQQAMLIVCMDIELTRLHKFDLFHPNFILG